MQTEVNKNQLTILCFLQFSIAKYWLICCLIWIKRWIWYKILCFSWKWEWIFENLNNFITNKIIFICEIHICQFLLRFIFALVELSFLFILDLLIINEQKSTSISCIWTQVERTLWKWIETFLLSFWTFDWLNRTEFNQFNYFW